MGVDFIVKVGVERGVGVGVVGDVEFHSLRGFFDDEFFVFAGAFGAGGPGAEVGGVKTIDAVVIGV